jgi:hypothetical protein
LEVTLAFSLLFDGVSRTPTTILKLLGSSFGVAFMVTGKIRGYLQMVTGFGSALLTTAKRASGCILPLNVVETSDL